MRHTRLTQASLVMLCVLMALGLSAQSGTKLHWRLSLGHDGWTVPSSWTPLRLFLDQALADGRLELERSDASGRQRSLETYPLKHAGSYEFPLFTDEFAANLRIRLCAGASVLAEQNFQPGQRVFPGHIIMTIGLPASVQQSLANLLQPAEPVMTIAASLADLPSLGLDYDALSVVVMADPGPILSPAQKTAMGQWLASGGTLLVMEARAGNSSIASQFSGPLGLGRLVSLAAHSISAQKLLDSRWWQSQIRLESYEFARRLSPSQVFARSFDRPTGIMVQDRGSVAPIAIVGIWAGLCLLGIMFLRRRWTLLAVLASCVLTLILLLAGPERFGWWDRGLAWHGRSLILPVQAGRLDMAAWWSERNAVLPGLDKELSPWSAPLWLSSGSIKETGLVNPGLGPISRWNHAEDWPVMAVRSAGDRRLIVVGFSPTTRTGPAMARLKVEGDVVQWQIPRSSGGWQEAEKVPAALAADSSWLIHVAGLQAGQYWQAGIGQAAAGGTRFGRDGHEDQMVTWIEPIIPGDKP